jgi:hypothetical protein
MKIKFLDDQLLLVIEGCSSCKIGVCYKKDYRADLY